MGLYDDRLADLSERRDIRAASRRPQRTPGERPYPRSSPYRRPESSETSRSRSTAIQSLLFQRDAGWTESKAKSWAKSHGYKQGSVDVTDQYIRLRQFSPEGLKVKRTITLGRGIRAVVAREESMRTVKATRRPRRSKKKVARRAPRKRSRRKATKKATTRRRRRRVSAAAVQAPRRRRRRAAVAAVVAAPRRRRRRRVKAWRGDSARHSAAAKKGHRRRKARKAKRKTTRRRRSRRTREVMAAPRRRRRRVHAVAAPRRRRYASASRRGGMDFAGLTVAALSTGLGFVLADGLDRFLATYSPTAAEKPKDKFTSDGAGTLANTLNVASRPGLVRIGAGIGMVAVPAFGSMYVRSPMIKAAAQGVALGAFASVFKTVWNNLLMPLLKPKDTSAASLQKSYIARLYPAEVSACINRDQLKSGTTTVPGGALSGGDVGPFALAAESPYPDAAQALRREAGIQGPGGDYPTVQNTWGTGGSSIPGQPGVSEYPTAAQAMYRDTGKVGDWSPGPPAEHGVGPQAKPGEDPSCGCIGDNPHIGFIGDKQEETLY